MNKIQDTKRRLKSRTVISVALLLFAASPVPCYAQAADGFLSSLDKPSLVLFYSRYCVPCHAEMKILPDLVKEATGWNMAVVAITKPDAELVQKISDLNIRLIDLSGPNAVSTLKSLNDRLLAMPFALATDKSGTICARRNGLLGTDTIKDWRWQCSL